MRSTFSLALPLLAAGGALFAACGDASRANPSNDAGPGDETFEPLPACPEARVCPRVLSSTSAATVQLDAVAGGNVQLGPGVMTAQGAVVPWGASSCCGGGLAAAGVTLLEDHDSLTVSTGSFAGLRQEIPLPIFARGDELGGIDPFGNFDRVVPLDMNPLRAQSEIVVPLGGAPDAVPAVIGVGQAVAALLGPAPRFVMLDATLGERLVDLALPGSAAERLTLTETCNGLLATFNETGSERLNVAAFDKLGRRRAPLRKYDVRPSLMAPNAVWDGASVVLLTADEVLELDTNGELRSRTPTPSTPLAAVGSRAGMLALLSSPGDSGDPRIAVVERGTGKVLLAVGTLPTGDSYGITGSALAVQRTVYFATSSYQLRDRISYLRVSCTESE